MRVAFPVKENRGTNSVISDHFGVAETFLIVDTTTGACEIKTNKKMEKDNKKCKTTLFSKNDRVSAVVTRCMGDGSYRSLSSASIKIYRAGKETVYENLELLENDQLPFFHMFDFCRTRKNKKEGGCGHH